MLAKRQIQLFAEDSDCRSIFLCRWLNELGLQHPEVIPGSQMGNILERLAY